MCPWPLGLCGPVLIFEIKIGEGGATSAGPGFYISPIRVLISLSVVVRDSHLVKSESICPFAI